MGYLRQKAATSIRMTAGTSCDVYSVAVAGCCFRLHLSFCWGVSRRGDGRWKRVMLEMNIPGFWVSRTRVEVRDVGTGNSRIGFEQSEKNRLRTVQGVTVPAGPEWRGVPRVVGTVNKDEMSDRGPCSPTLHVCVT